MPLPPLELRDADLARAWLLGGLALAPTDATGSSWRGALRWCRELLEEGRALLPLGVLADLGALAVGAGPAPGGTASDGGASDGAESAGAALGGESSGGNVGGGGAPSEGNLGPRRSLAAHALSAELTRVYEDYFLGKLYADATFERASAAASRFAGRDRDRAVAFIAGSLADRLGARLVALSPNIVRTLERTPLEQLTLEVRQAIEGGLPEELTAAYCEIGERIRGLGDLLGVEDLFELEYGTALVAFGQRLALRQMIQAAAFLEEALPARRPPESASRRDVPTPIHDEDFYPVGGYSSLSTRGSIESLLQSQLAYMEREAAARPDMFDIKFLRDELLYFARDENQFLRKRRCFVFQLTGELAALRIRQGDLPWQTIIVLLGCFLALSRRLTAWLGDESLSLEFHFPDGPDADLALERELLELVFREAIAQKTVVVENLTPQRSAGRVEYLARRSAIRRLLVAPARSKAHGNPAPVQPIGGSREGFHVPTARLWLGRGAPALEIDDEDPPDATPPPDDDPSGWKTTAVRLAEFLV